MAKHIAYLRRTWKNKLVAIILIVGSAVAAVIDGDGTAFVLLTMMMTPLLVAKEDCVSKVFEGRENCDKI